MNHSARIRGRMVKSSLAAEFIPFDVSRSSAGECPKSASDSANSRLCGGYAAPENSNTEHDIYAGRTRQCWVQVDVVHAADRFVR